MEKKRFTKKQKKELRKNSNTLNEFFGFGWENMRSSYYKMMNTSLNEKCKEDENKKASKLRGSSYVRNLYLSKLTRDKK